ncbi:MAG: TonB-dependent receptor plug domain-containing protein [Pseudomonadota bacterium]
MLLSMRARVLRCCGFVGALLSVAPIAAEPSGSIEEVVVTASESPSRVARPALVLDNEDLRERQPVAVADVFRNVSGVSMRTNSRGDSVVRIRGAEERQTLVFLDGAPLATPWDGRTDLALLPAGLVDRIEVTRGIAPIEYGANAIAGAVDLTTFIPSGEDRFRGEVQGGSKGLLNANGLLGFDTGGPWSFVVGGSRIERDAERIADKNSVPFDPSTNDERTNTDYSGSSVFGAVSYSGERALFRASLLHGDIERGIAAQGNRDPAISSPRFWRIPDWQLTQLTLNGSWIVSPRTDLRLTGWRQWFDQTIDSYTDYSYSVLDERETGEDDTVGARLVLATEYDWGSLRWVATTQDSIHRQVEAATVTGDAAGLISDPLLRYRQKLSTVGVEADWQLSDAWTSTWGIGRDRASTPLTGDKPDQRPLSATGWSAGLRYTPGGDWSGSITIGERTRFPTPRELFGVALGRFLLNPDLRPERSLLTDITAQYSGSERFTFDAAVWVNDSDDTLSQRSVNVGGASLRQRYNTNGAFTYGIETSTVISLLENFRTEFSFAIQDGEAERDGSGDRPPLLQRPEEQVNLAFDWQANRRTDLRAEVSYTGAALDLDDDGNTVRLPSSTTVSLRAFIDVGSVSGQRVLLTAALDNVTDELILPQLGLPAPGRSVHLGFRIN